MAIGSTPEIGSSFKSCREYTMQDWEKWWQYMRDNWHPWLHNGWATLVHNKKGNPYYD